jgi:pyruvate/2-oxoglutarate/acetoin dehydrogenase E1 component
VRYVARGKQTAPITVRSQQAALPGACAQHAQSLEALFAHVPGLRVCLPATAQDAYELLRSAVVCDDPVVVLETRALYQQRAEVTLGGPVQPPGGSRVVRDGGDVTIVSWSRMVGEAVAAAEALAAAGIDAAVIDLRWLSPLDLDPVLASVERTGRLVVAHEANRTGGFGAEIATRVAAEAFDALDAPIERVALPDVRIPAAPSLNRALVPNSETIQAAVRRVAL